MTCSESAAPDFTLQDFCRLTPTGKSTFLRWLYATGAVTVTTRWMRKWEKWICIFTYITSIMTSKRNWGGAESQKKKGRATEGPFLSLGGKAENFETHLKYELHFLIIIFANWWSSGRKCTQLNSRSVGWVSVMCALGVTNPFSRFRRFGTVSRPVVMTVLLSQITL